MKDTTQIRVGANGSIYVAPVGTVAPTDSTVVWPAGWTDLGYANEDGVTVTKSKDVDEIPVWQMLFPARRIATGAGLNVSFVLRQWSDDTIEFALEGTVTTPDAVNKPNERRFTPNAPEVITERALGVEWVDGTVRYRLIVPRGMITDDVEFQLQRSDAANLPIGFDVLGQDGADPFYLLTNDPAMA